MTCALVSHLETASEPRKALWEGVETAVLENAKFKKVVLKSSIVYKSSIVWYMTISYAGIKVVLMIILFWIAYAYYLILTKLTKIKSSHFYLIEIQNIFIKILPSAYDTNEWRGPIPRVDI